MNQYRIQTALAERARRGREHAHRAGDGQYHTVAPADDPAQVRPAILRVVGGHVLDQRHVQPQGGDQDQDADPGEHVTVGAVLFGACESGQHRVQPERGAGAGEAGGEAAAQRPGERQAHAMSCSSAVVR